MPYQIVAVYGSLKKGFSNHRLLEEAEFIGNAVVGGWDMYSFGYYPMIIPGSGLVSVELYAVSAAEFQSLDNLEGYPSFYDRRKIAASTERGPVQAWIYFGDADQVKGLPKVETGNWTQETRLRGLEHAWR